ncbi:uncharacterized protein LOC126836057 [Adelges cooleyi]|uniref:uncharacterized protein LOC126836057 n=1 Tax=Adelges cooleyi TaxID=133065 RepID=UPI00217FFCFE|nr:uncharacterized protein LOC126836057 [Adelges cooleyi]
MKLFFLLISLAFVNVSTYYDIINYKQDVVITNEHIKLAFKKEVIKVNSVANGLEHVIEQIIGNDEYTLGMMINMIALPEYPYHSEIEVCKEIQIFMREEIQNELKIDVPKVPNQNFKELNLDDLGNERRKLTGKALTNIWNKAIVGSDKDEESYSYMCYMIAVFMSTKFPLSYKRDIRIEPDGTCTMYDGVTKKTYKKYIGKWWQVIGNCTDDWLQLEEEPIDNFDQLTIH